MINKFIICAAMLGLVVNPASAGGPDKSKEDVSTPFQIIIRVNVEGFGANSDTFMFEDDSTALIEYVACEYRFASFDPSTKAQLELVTEIYQGPDNVGSATIIAPELRDKPSITPSPIDKLVSSDVVSACIGNSCESLDGVHYKSLILRVTRNVPNANTEYADCLVKGMIY